MLNIDDSHSLSYADNEQILNLLPIPIAVLKGELFVISFANDAMFELWRRDRTVQTIGLPITTAFPETNVSFLAQLEKVFRTGVPYKDEEVLLTLNDGTGKVYSIFIDYTYQAIFGDEGIITGILVTAQDVSRKVSAKQLLHDTTEELKNSNHALSSSNEECLMAIATANLGTWKLFVDRDELSFSERSAAIFGLKQQEVSLRSVLHLVRKDHRQSVIQTLQEIADSGQTLEIEYPINPENSDQERWVRLTGRGVVDVQGHAMVLKGTMMDITSSKMELIRKDEFIGIASHELKTPLTSLNGLLQLLSRRLDLKKDDNLGEMMVLTLSQLRKMTRIITSFVTISRLESGKFELELTDFDIGELLNEQLKEVRMTAAGHTFIQEGCQKLHIKADRIKIGALLSNLISNAVKYTPTGKSITVSCRQKLKFLEISVKDEGTGIAEADKERIFERYSQIENPHVKNSAGFGIGLFLCAEIVRHHKGEIWVENNEDAGCTFYFKLPVFSGLV
ncbi:ATP-binding protein [Pedobacter sp. UYP1]|uniref:sensor histidine kinase n=1 Tax=Pedobacter sp. UYP1 TaxID=1756396 RepID=UPI00339A2FE3